MNFKKLKLINPVFITLGLFTILVTISCYKEQNTIVATTKPALSNILILGNSITQASANPSIGWNNNWGMAATAADSDYVHRLTTLFSKKNSNCKVTAFNIAAFETGFASYDFDANLKTYRDSKPDLLIIRIGENVQDGFNATLFNTRYAALLAYFKSANPTIQVYAFGSFWPGKSVVDDIMKKYSPFLSLSYLGNDRSNYSYGLWIDSGIQYHPSNKGMRLISAAIWQRVGTLTKP
ncbi:SGNH/GDSL hydrolase family protein [uncultured Mucilaginibacter sp.]|uniref:SGNH/GDSL hydrolase family protein n=1 Tax=uncultured Mucilaginibacter sp. TaxID=797541 RepID=UPI002637298F|nr:SGNH/GDSL hydrolase family protein [uncultured Mucilaginibacter sp.]